MQTSDTAARVVRPPAGRLHFLDFLRGVAALVVMLGHSTNENGWLQSLSPFLHQDFDTGRLGVTTFFLVSGFVIPLTLERRGSIRAFVVNRFFRLYPLYWLSIIVLVAWIALRVPLDAQYYAMFEKHFARNVLVNLTMLQEFLRVPNAIPVFWTLTVELIFYGLCVCLFRLGLLGRSLQIAWCVLGVVAVCSIVLPVALHRRIPFEHVYAFAAFFFGTAVYRHYEGLVSSRNLRWLTGGAIVVALAGVAFNYDTFADSSERIGPIAASLAYLGAFTLFLSAYMNRHRPYPRVFIWLGTISYSVYLLHSLAIESAVGLFGENARMLVGVPLTLAISTVTYRLLEAPAVRLGHRVAKRFYVVPRETGTVARERAMVDASI